MLKKFFALSFAIAIFLFSAQVQADSQTEYVGIFTETGQECYLVLDTIAHLPDPEEIGFSATFQLVGAGGNIDLVEYSFWFEKDSAENLILTFKNSAGESGSVKQNENNIKYLMFRAIAEHYNN